MSECFPKHYCQMTLKVNDEKKADNKFKMYGRQGCIFVKLGKQLVVQFNNPIQGTPWGSYVRKNVRSLNDSLRFKEGCDVIIFAENLMFISFHEINFSAFRKILTVCLQICLTISTTLCVFASIFLWILSTHFVHYLTQYVHTGSLQRVQ